MLLQEHHLNEAKCVKYKKGMKLKNGVVFWNLSLQLGHSQHWCVRTIILMASNITLAIFQYSIIMEGRTYYIILKISNVGSIRIINIYAVQTSRERALMWKAIVDHDLNVIEWVLVGEFNMIKDGHQTNAIGHNFMKR